MKKYVPGFLICILAAVLTGMLLAGYIQWLGRNSAREAGYNLVFVNGMEEPVEKVQISYALGDATRVAESREVLASEGEARFLLDASQLTYRVTLQTGGDMLAEAELTDDFRQNAICRYRIESDGQEIVLRVLE